MYGDQLFEMAQVAEQEHMQHAIMARARAQAREPGRDPHDPDVALQPGEGRHRQQRHQHQGRQRQVVPCPGRGAGLQQEPQQERHQRPLPEEVRQGPPQRRNQTGEINSITQLCDPLDHQRLSFR